VSFTDLEQDARRRDFTINALYYDPVIEMIDDHVGGLDDLRGRRLRTVGRADERFHEDRLRMLRAVRFVAQLGFNLDPEALQAIRRLGAELRGVSAERILAEVRRLLEGAYLSEGLKALQLSGLAEFFWPEISTLPLKALKSFAAFNRWENAFAALMWLSGNDGACEVRLSAWKAARDSQRVVREQIEALEVLRDPASRRADRAHALGGDVFADVLVLAGGVFENEGQAARLDAWVKEYLEVADADGRLPPPLISGQDLIANGVPPGPAMGEILKRLYDLQLEGGIRSKAEALERINK
jgi:tRNA nucleotidyltransferase/poly(A) polymerase